VVEHKTLSSNPRTAKETIKISKQTQAILEYPEISYSIA
jgi:hypothetical protein